MGKSAKVKDDGNVDENDSIFFLSSELMPCHLAFPFPFHFTEKKNPLIRRDAATYIHQLYYIVV